MLAIIRCSLLSSSLLSKNIKVKIYRTIILPVVLYGCETWSLIFREEHRQRVFENRVLKRIFLPKRDKMTGEWRKLHKPELNDLYCSPIVVQVIKLRRMRLAGHVARMGRAEKYTGFLWGNRKERDHLEDLGIDGRIKLRWIFKKWDVRAWTGSIWLRIGTGRALVNAVMNLGVL